MFGQRGIFAIAQLDDAGHLHEIDAGAIVEGPGDGRARDDQHLHAAIGFDQRMRDGAAAAQVAKSECVVAVKQDARVLKSCSHAVHLSQRVGGVTQPVPKKVEGQDHKDDR